jgi:hypothetical protein
VDKIEMILVVSSGRPNQYTANPSVNTVDTSRRVPPAALLQCANTTKGFLSARSVAAAVYASTVGFEADAPSAVALPFAGTVE